MKIFLILNESIGKRFLSSLNYDYIEISGISVNKKSNDFDYFLKYSKKNRFKLFDHKSIKSKKFKIWLSKNVIDLVLNIFSYAIIPSDIINIPKIGFFNLHPGKLPEYSGLNPISWSIFNGEKSHYVTLHWLTKNIDAGPIVYSKFFKIYKNDTAIKVLQNSINLGLCLLHELIKQVNKDSKKIPKIKQKLIKRKYYSKNIPNNGFVNWNLKANKIYDFIRAFDYKPYNTFWLEPKIKVNNKIFQIIKVKVSSTNCNLKYGKIKVVSNKYIKISSLDKWIIVLKMKYNKSYINPLEYFNQEDKIENFNN